MPIQPLRTRLSVNLNKVALLRNQRDHDFPSVARAARTVLAAGAGGITMHPRPDRRHALPSDVRMLRSVVEEFGAELNIEGNPTDSFIALVREVKPHQVTLVPDEPSARTSDHGWDLLGSADIISSAIVRLADSGARVSIFVDYDAQVVVAKDLGAHAVELYTEPYALGHAAGNTDILLEKFAHTARAAAQAGLQVHAGHDLNLENLQEFLCHVPEVVEVSIGHAFTAEALWLGMTEVTMRYLQLIKEVSQS